MASRTKDKNVKKLLNEEQRRELDSIINEKEARTAVFDLKDNHDFFTRKSIGKTTNKTEHSKF